MSKSSEVNAAGTGQRRFSRHILRLFIALAAVGLVVAVSKIPRRQTDTVPTDPPPVNVTVMTVTAEPELPDMLLLPGVIEPNRITTVSAEISGRIEHIGPEKGRFVKTDDLIMQINTALIAPLRETAYAQYERDRLELQRMQDLVQKQATAQRDLDDAATRLAVSRASLDEITARLERARITAPSSGILNDLLVEEGEYVDAATAVAQLVQTDVVKVAVEVPERDIAFFATGQSAEVLVHTPDCEKTLPGRITFISAVADAQTRSTRVEILLENPDKALHSGQIVQTRLIRRVLQNALLIPLLAVIPMENGKCVYVVTDHQAQRREVKLGLIKGDQVLITHGLMPGDQLIIAGHRFVAPGRQVNIVPEQP